MVKIVLSLFVVLYAGSSFGRTKSSDTILKFKSYSQLSQQNKIKYIQKLQKILIYAESHQQLLWGESSFAFNTKHSFYNILIDHANAADLSVGSMCVYAGHISKLIFTNDKKLVCERPSSKCGEDKVQCNTALFGATSDGDAICVNKGGYATRDCLSAAPPIEDIVNSLSAENWQDIEKINSYCKDPHNFQKNICDQILSARTDALLSLRSNDPNTEASPACNDCETPSSPVLPSGLQEQLTPSKCFSKEGIESCIQKQIEGLISGSGLSAFYDVLRLGLATMDKLPELGAKGIVAVSSFAWQFAFNSEYRTNVINEIAMAVVDAVQSLILGATQGWKNKSCAEIRDMGCKIVGELLGEGLSVIVPLGIAVKATGSGAKAAAAVLRVMQKFPSVKAAIKGGVDKSDLDQITKDKLNEILERPLDTAQSGIVDRVIEELEGTSNSENSDKSPKESTESSSAEPDQRAPGYRYAQSSETKSDIYYSNDDPSRYFYVKKSTSLSKETNLVKSKDVFKAMINYAELNTGDQKVKWTKKTIQTKNGKGYEIRSNKLAQDKFYSLIYLPGDTNTVIEGHSPWKDRNKLSKDIIGFADKSKSN